MSFSSGQVLKVKDNDNGLYEGGGVPLRGLAAFHWFIPAAHLCLLRLRTMMYG